jgi:hypothetical protein
MFLVKNNVFISIDKQTIYLENLCAHKYISSFQAQGPNRNAIAYKAMPPIREDGRVI